MPREDGSYLRSIRTPRDPPRAWTAERVNSLPIARRGGVRAPGRRGAGRYTPRPPAGRDARGYGDDPRYGSTARFPRGIASASGSHYLRAHMRPITLLLRARDLAVHSLLLPAALVVLATGAARAEETPPAPPPAAEPDRDAEPGAPRPSLDFDLLGAAKPPPERPDAGALRLRRRMLGVHQGLGLGLLGLQLATTVVGQLNYSDRFAGGPDTARYRRSHQALAYATLGLFVVNGAVALLAPSAKGPRKLDRVMVHRVAMFTAAAGMAAQVVLGLQTRDRVGRLDQERLATRHLAVGYVTLAAVLAGVGAIVF
jgi:hypothetical protein